MPRVIEAHLKDTGGAFAIVVSRFNEFINKSLLEGAVDTLRRHGIDVEARVTVVWVPGAYEMPLAVQKLCGSGAYAGVVALGSVIRGSTPHFDYVAGAVSSGLSKCMLDTGVPVAFGVLTTDTIEQALERAGTKMGNKGGEAALAALEMVGLVRALDSAHSAG